MRSVIYSRPLGRRAQIVRTAAEAFHEHGYHGVGIDEIAARNGVSGPALYKHFRSKLDLLRLSFAGGLGRYDHDVGPAADLEDLLRRHALFALERRDLGVLWQRDARYLPPEDRDVVRSQLRANAHRTASLLREERPELTQDEALLLSWGVFAVFNSFSYHRSAARPRLVYRMARAVTGHQFCDSADEPGVSPTVQPGNRREELLTAAVDLFYVRGFPDVGIAAIGAAVGISGAAVYRHFPDKAAVLAAALERGADLLSLSLLHADGLPAAVRAYADAAVAHPAAIGVLISETVHLPPDPKHAIRRTQHDYVAAWIRLLLAERPELPRTEARVLVHGALTVINDLVRTPVLRSRAHPAAELTGLALGVLRQPTNVRKP